MAKNSSATGVEFLFTELQSGLTFAHLAISAPQNHREKVERNRKNARKAYDSLLRFQGGISLTKEEAERFETGKNELRQALRALGEAL